MGRLRDRVTCALANAFLVAALAVFAIGFFPHKAFLPGLAEWPVEGSKRTSSPFDKVIFMVVDALRSDFVYGNTSNFEFTQGLIRKGAALPFTGHASAPTITMPRVKAITTGSVPSFLDLVLNFAESDTTSTLATQDSWLAQMKKKNSGKLIMYGDDTWLRLFPGFFDRSDGTTSFFVSDFTEVDNNVTRHIPDELRHADWSVMVMHFLGLDHIGHKTGPTGPNMPAKQREMDDIVRMIYEAMEAQPHLQSSLLVLLGDHGMNEAGNHGASSAGEVSTALTFISPTFRLAYEGLASPLSTVSDFKYYEEVEQSDIAPTLASLLGFPIPKNNLGVIIPRLLELWTSEADRLELLYENAAQIQQIAEATFPDAFSTTNTPSPCTAQDPSDAERLSCAWSRIHMDQAATASGRSASSITAFLRLAQELLSGTASNYDLAKMWLGISLATVATALSLILAFNSAAGFDAGNLVLILLTVAYGGTMFASSYVEEEQQFWYWALGGWLAVAHLKQRRFQGLQSAWMNLSVPAIAVAFCILRHWNQTGQKYAGDPDLVTRVLAPYNYLLWALVILTYAFISRRLSSSAGSWVPNHQLALLPAVICIVAFAFKVTFTAADAPELLEGVFLLGPLLRLVAKFPLVGLARVVFLGIAQLFLGALYYEAPWGGKRHRHNFIRVVHDLLTLLLVTQTRTTNIPIFAISMAQHFLLARGCSCSSILSSSELSLASLLLQFSSFFMLGGSNAVSSVDLSNAYNGVSGYNAVAVGLLTFVSNWAGPIWWLSATCCIISKASADGVKEDGGFFPVFASMTFFASGSTLSTMVACAVLREHLFIWTVFSPKYLYSIAWVVAHHVLFGGILANLLVG